MRRAIEDASDDEVGRLLQLDPELKRLGRRIRREQGRLKQLIPWEAWQIYLRIEEASNECMFMLIEKLLNQASTAAPKAHARRARGEG